MATITGRTLSGVLGTDVVSYSGGAASFDTKNVGTGKTVTGAGLTLTGADAGNYTVNSSATTTADITALGITGSITAANKVYDATDVAAILTRTLTGVLATDVVNYSGGTATFSDKDVGAGKTVTGAGLSLTGADAGNYTVNSTATTTADITPAALAINAVTDSRVYNGTTSSAGVVTYSGLRTGDTLTGLSQAYASKNVMGALGSTLNVNGGYTLTDGNAGGNYSITTNSAVGTITALSITGSITAANKVYDATDVATITGRTLSGVLSTDVVSYSGGTATFSDKNAAAGKTVTGSGLSLIGADAGNYTVSTTTTTTADITPAPLAIKAVTDSRVYNGTTGSMGVVTYSGLQTGDTLTDLSQAYASKNVMGALGSTLNVNGGYMLNDGNAGGNYTVTTNSAAGTITPATLTVVANPQSKVYGTIDPALIYTTDALQFGDTAGSILTGTLSRAAGEDVNSYVIGQNTLASNANYTIAYTGNNLTITPATLNVTANPQSKLFGQSDPPLTFVTTGLVNNPSLGITDTADSVLSGTLTRAPGESALGGPYAITQGSLAPNSNYTLGFTLNNLFIVGAAAEPVLGFNAGQVIFFGVINNEFYYRPGNFWHISLNPNNADPGFDVMRGTNDLKSRLGDRLNRCDSVTGGGFCETWSFPEQRGRIDN